MMAVIVQMRALTKRSMLAGKDGTGLRQNKEHGFVHINPASFPKKPIMGRRAAALLCLTIVAACGKSAGPPRRVIGFAQVSSSAPLDEARDGFFRALADSGMLEDSAIKVLERNAQGDVPTLSLIMSDFIQQG